MKSVWKVERKTIAQQLSETGNHPSGFDYIRLVLATSIILFHTVVTSYGYAAQQALDKSAAGLLVTQIVPMFFCLSGFLVAGSLARSRSLLSFWGLRAYRIFPALMAETLLSAILLGAIFTTLPLSEYFRSPVMWSYLHNLHGKIHYYLPGVFVRNPSDKVNGQLWTIPAELQCYIDMGIAFILTLARRPRALLVLCCGWMIFRILNDAFLHKTYDTGFFVPAQLLIFCFFGGVILFELRETLVWDWRWGAAMSAVALALPLVPYGVWLMPIPTCYATIWLGLFNPQKPWAGDYSYGLYLYGYPIQQAVASFPLLRHWWLNLLIAYPLAFGFAFLSWHLLEKQVLKARPLLFRLEAAVLSAIDRFLPPAAYKRLPGV